MSFAISTQIHFHTVRAALFNELRQGEELNLNLTAEDSLYVRFNGAKVRQNTNVQQRQLEMIFQVNARRCQAQFELSGAPNVDITTGRNLILRLRAECAVLPPDTSLTPLQNHGSSLQMDESRELSLSELLQDLKLAADGTDFTGLLASGPMVRASANHLGQSHWLSNRSFFLDYSLFTVNSEGENKAIKACYADRQWANDLFLGQLSAAKKQLSLLRRPSLKLQPGKYRVFLAPSAVGEISNMLSWGALSHSAFRKGHCALADLVVGKKQLSPLLSLRENFTLGLTPRFNSLGELPPERVELISEGRLVQLLTSSRTAREYGVSSNQADTSGWFSEGLRSLEIAPGQLPEKDALQALGTGIFVSNLHYCNWSDLQTARITGMTRYACFWVENGEIRAPIQDLRFDVSLYSIFGEQLKAITKEQHIDPAVDTYVQRSMGGRLLPGMLIEDFHFTL